MDINVKGRIVKLLNQENSSAIQWTPVSFRQTVDSEKVSCIFSEHTCLYIGNENVRMPENDREVRFSQSIISVAMAVNTSVCLSPSLHSEVCS